MAMPHRIWRRRARILPLWSAWLWIVLGACGEDGTVPVGPEEPDTVVDSIWVKPSERTIGVLGVTFELAASAHAADGSHLYGLGGDPHRFSFSSSAPEVATVNEVGLITGVGEGSATIDVTVEDVTESMAVTVRDRARLAWSVTEPLATSNQIGTISAGIAIGADGTIYVVAKDRIASTTRLSALSPQGGVLWTRDTPGIVISTPAIGDDGTLYLGSSRGLTAVSPAGGIRWMLPDLGDISSSPAVGSAGTIYAASGDGIVYAVDPEGEIQWAYDGSGRFWLSSPAVASDGTVYVGGSGGRLHAINPDGSSRWTFEAGDQIQSSPSIGTDGTVYFGSYDGRLYAVNPDGTERWRSVRLGNPTTLTSSPSIGPDGTIYIGASGVFAIDPTGSVRWNYAPSHATAITPILGASGTIYLGGVALDTQGRLLWDYPTGSFGSPAIGSDGTILATTNDGTLYAFVENASTNGGYEGAPWPTARGGRTNSGRAGG